MFKTGDKTTLRDLAATEAYPEFIGIELTVLEVTPVFPDAFDVLVQTPSGTRFETDSGNLELPYGGPR